MLKAGRVGVAPKEVDPFGNIIGGGGGGTGYTKEETDALLDEKVDIPTLSTAHNITLIDTTALGTFTIGGTGCKYYEYGDRIIVHLDMTNASAGSSYSDYIIAEGLPKPIDVYGDVMPCYVNVDDESALSNIKIYVDADGKLHYSNRYSTSVKRKYVYLEYIKAV